MQGSVSELNEKIMFFFTVFGTRTCIHSFRAYDSIGESLSSLRTIIIVAGPSPMSKVPSRLRSVCIMRTYRINNQICKQEVMASREPRIKFVRRNKVRNAIKLGLGRLFLYFYFLVGVGGALWSALVGFWMDLG